MLPDRVSRTSRGEKKWSDKGKEGKGGNCWIGIEGEGGKGRDRECNGGEGRGRRGRSRVNVQYATPLGCTVQ